MDKIGFIFTEKKILYIKSDIKCDFEKMYTSETPGDTTDTKNQKEDY